MSIVVQATEYRKADTEVKAEDILNQIEYGNNIYLRNCSIVGDLDISKIKLGTVRNPDYDVSRPDFPIDIIPGKLYFSDPIDKKLNLIKSNIRIKNSIFENGVYFHSAFFTKRT